MELVGFKIFKYLNPIKRIAVDTCLELNFGTKTYIWVKGVIFTGLRMSLNFKPRFLEMIEFDCAFHFVLSVWFWWKNSRNDPHFSSTTFFSFTSLWEEDYKVAFNYQIFWGAMSIENNLYIGNQSTAKKNFDLDVPS